MNKIASYSLYLKYRIYFKRIQQLSWSVNKMETRFDSDNLNEEELESMISAYEDRLKEAKSILNDLPLK